MLRLDVDGDAVRPRRDEARQVVVGAGDHEVHIEENVVRLVDCLHHRRAERNIVHEMAVHHIEVQPIRPGVDGAGGFLAHFREIRS